MPQLYKIVQTIENGKPQICPVPSQWVKDDKILLWPPAELSEKALAKPATVLPSDNWEKWDCVVKRDHIVSYSLALTLSNEMTNTSETDGDNSSSADDENLNAAAGNPKRRTAVRLSSVDSVIRCNYNVIIYCIFYYYSISIYIFICL